MVLSPYLTVGVHKWIFLATLLMQMSFTLVLVSGIYIPLFQVHVLEYKRYPNDNTASHKLPVVKIRNQLLWALLDV